MVHACVCGAPMCPATPWSQTSLMIAFIPGSPSWQTVWIRKPPSDAHASRLACCLDPLEAFLLQYIGQFFTDVQEHWQAGRQNDDWKTVSAETWTES